ncbi:MAG TPA: amino acid adenylation domain-containing protein [Herpetosiphonaceae bacterium]
MSRLSANKRALLKALLADSAEPTIVQRIPRRPADAPTPLSFAQQRLWFLDRFDAGGQQYALCSATRLIGRLDQAALSHSLSAVVRRHETLRTTIGMAADQPVQVVAPRGEIALAEVDLSSYDASDRQLQVEQIIAGEGRRPFDLTAGPLLRALLLRLGPDDQILLIIMHHIISDGWSMSVFLRELSAYYRARIAKDTIDPQPELPIQYADYAIWQRAQLSGAALDEQLGYWRKQLADAPTVLELPTDRPRPARQTFNGARYSFTLSSELTAQVAALSQQEGATPFMTLLAAFQVLLSRYTGQDDLLVGSPIANRTHAEVEPLIGFFVNTLVLRADLRDRVPSGCSFREALRGTRETALGAYAHQDLPFEKLVEELQPERDLSRSPLIQVMFILQNTPGEALDLPGLTATRLDVSNGGAVFDLTLQLTESAGSLHGLCEYNTDLFDATTIARLAAHYAVLLQAIVADPDRSVAELPLLTAAEQEQLDLLNATRVEYPQDLLPAWLSAQAQRTPEQTALIFRDRRLSYRELEQRANQLARHLQSLGVGPESRVGLCVERSPELVIGLLGILKAGGAYVPLDPTHPAERLGFILADARISLLVTQADLVARLPASAAESLRLVRLDADATQIAELSAEPPVSAAAPDSLAYMIYTSGTTGQPKGVQIEHRNLINTLRAAQQTFGFQSGDVMPWLAAVTFDIALFELFNPLLVGGTTLILTHDDVLNLPQLAAQLRDVTLIHAVPSLMRQIVQTVQQDASPQAYSRLRTIFVGGEAVPPALVADLQAVFSRAQVQILYGPTEATIICAHHATTRGEAIAGNLIGSPMPNVQVRVYDRHRQRVPIGVAGELYIGGAGVTRGYWQQAQLSATQFVTIDGQRWYRSGDLVRFRADSSLEFLGRIDQQVKVRGFRIELGEIEALLNQHPAVRQAVVVPHITGDDTRLVAYVEQRTKEQRTKEQNENGEPRTQNLEPSENPEPRTQNLEPNEEQGHDPDSALSPSPAATEAEARRGSGQGGVEQSETGVRASSEGLVSTLRDYLKERLPDYMLPATFMVLDALPLSAHGKVDRKALPAPEWRSAAETAFVAPRDELDEVLAQIWSELLGVERVGVRDNFFELGGHSLLATQLATRILHTFQVELPLRRLFESPTIAGLHDVIEDLLIEKLASLSEDEVEQLAASVHDQSAHSL